MLIWIQLKRMVTGVVFELQTHKSKIKGVSNGLHYCFAIVIIFITTMANACSPMFGHLFDTIIVALIGGGWPQYQRSGFEPWPGTLCFVLEQDTLLSQSLSSPRCINGYLQT